MFAALGAAIVAGALVAPLMSGHDEGSHAIRGAAVVRGQLFGDPAPEAFPPEPNVFIHVDVPEAYALATPAGCFNKRRDLTPECAPELEGGRTTEPVLTYQFRSQPAYYLVALPTLVDPAAGGMYATRLVSGLVCAALLTSALSSARTARRIPEHAAWSSRWAVIGVAVAVTPEVLYLSSSMNSNAVEVTAAVAAWSGLAAMAAQDPRSGRLVTRTGLAVVVLVGTRGLSPAFAALTVAAVAVTAGWSRARAWAARRDVRLWGIAAGVTAVASLLYIEWVRRQLPIEREGQGLAAAVDLLPWYLRQAVGIFGSNDILLPDAVYAVWGAAVVGLLVTAIVVGRDRAAAVVAGVAVAGVALQVGAEGFSLPPIGFFWQGRYALPVLVGAPILAGRLLADRGVRLPTWGAVVVLAGLGVAHLAAFLQGVRRFAVTLDGPNNPWTYLTDARWSPPPGPALLWTVVFAGGLVAAGWLALRPPPRAGSA